MTKKKKKKARLGRGLGALLGDVQTTVSDQQVAQELASSATAGVATPNESGNGFKELPIEQLERGQYQPRLHMDKAALEEMAESIRAQGVVQPLLVRRLDKDRYEIIAGERRWRSAQLAGLSTVPAVVRDIPDQTAMAVGLIENIQREDLNAIEEAKGFARLLEEFGLTHQEIAQAVGRSRTAVSNLLRLLSLDSAVQKLVETGALEMGHARALLSLENKDQITTAKKVVDEGLSVRRTEQLVKSVLKKNALGEGEVDKSATAANPDIVRLEDDISTRLGAKVEIQHKNKKGKLVIHYHSLDELDGILERLK